MTQAIGSRSIPDFCLLFIVSVMDWMWTEIVAVLVSKGCSKVKFKLLSLGQIEQTTKQLENWYGWLAELSSTLGDDIC